LKVAINFDSLLTVIRKLLAKVGLGSGEGIGEFLT